MSQNISPEGKHMAQKVQVILVDDIDGGEANETVTFGLDGVTYEIDLSTEHAAELREAFASWVGHARKTARGGAPRTAARSGRTRRSTSDANEIRTWARENGHNVNDRGRISAEIREAYYAAH